MAYLYQYFSLLGVLASVIALPAPSSPDAVRRADDAGSDAIIVEVAFAPNTRKSVDTFLVAGVRGWVTQETATDKNLKYNMSCAAGILDEHKPGDHFTFSLDTTAPYVHPTAGTEVDNILKNALVICDSGECVAEDGCKGLEIPQFNQTYLEESYKPKTSRRSVVIGYNAAASNTETTDPETTDEEQDDDKGIFETATDLLSGDDDE